MRDAIGFCKSEQEITSVSDRPLGKEERLNFEKCLTQNYLMKYGMNYFGKRDLIYVDLYSNQDLANLNS